MNSRKIFLLLNLLIITGIYAQNPFAGQVDTLILKGIDQTFSCNFDSAMSLYQEIINKYPNHPAGYFYQAAVLQSRMMDEESTYLAKNFYSLINHSIIIGERILKKEKNNAWINFYLGSCHSYKGLFMGKQGKIIPAFITAKKGINHLKKALEIDSTLYDAWLGLGNYMYWSGHFYKYLKWLPWISDRRDEGINKINLAISRGILSHWAGLNSLGWIEYNRENYSTALTLFKDGLIKYPGSRFFLWGVADCLYRTGEFRQAVYYYEKLLDSITNKTSNNGYNEIECRIHLVVSYYSLKKYKKSYRQCLAILQRKTDRDINKRLKRHYRAADEYRKRCKNKLEEGVEAI